MFSCVIILLLVAFSASSSAVMSQQQQQQQPPQPYDSVNTVVEENDLLRFCSTNPAAVHICYQSSYSSFFYMCNPDNTVDYFYCYNNDCDSCYKSKTYKPGKVDNSLYYINGKYFHYNLSSPRYTVDRFIRAEVYADESAERYYYYASSRNCTSVESITSYYHRTSFSNRQSYTDSVRWIPVSDRVCLPGSAVFPSDSPLTQSTRYVENPVYKWNCDENEVTDQFFNTNTNQCSSALNSSSSALHTNVTAQDSCSRNDLLRLTCVRNIGGHQAFRLQAVPYNWDLSAGKTLSSIVVCCMVSFLVLFLVC